MMIRLYPPSASQIREHRLARFSPVNPAESGRPLEAAELKSHMDALSAITTIEGIGAYARSIGADTGVWSNRALHILEQGREHIAKTVNSVFQAEAARVGDATNTSRTMQQWISEQNTLLNRNGFNITVNSGEGPNQHNPATWRLFVNVNVGGVRRDSSDTETPVTLTSINLGNYGAEIQNAAYPLAVRGWERWLMATNTAYNRVPAARRPTFIVNQQAQIQVRGSNGILQDAGGGLQLTFGTLVLRSGERPSSELMQAHLQFQLDQLAQRLQTVPPNGRAGLQSQCGKFLRDIALQGYPPYRLEMRGGQPVFLAIGRGPNLQPQAGLVTPQPSPAPTATSTDAPRTTPRIVPTMTRESQREDAKRLWDAANSASVAATGWGTVPYEQAGAIGMQVMNDHLRRTGAPFSLEQGLSGYVVGAVPPRSGEAVPSVIRPASGIPPNALEQGTKDVAGAFTTFADGGEAGVKRLQGALAGLTPAASTLVACTFQAGAPVSEVRSEGSLMTREARPTTDLVLRSGSLTRAWDIEQALRMAGVRCFTRSGAVIINDLGRGDPALSGLANFPQHLQSLVMARARAEVALARSINQRRLSQVTPHMPRTSAAQAAWGAFEDALQNLPRLLQNPAVTLTELQTAVQRLDKTYEALPEEARKHTG